VCHRRFLRLKDGPDIGHCSHERTWLCNVIRITDTVGHTVCRSMLYNTRLGWRVFFKLFASPSPTVVTMQPCHWSLSRSSACSATVFYFKLSLPRIVNQYRSPSGSRPTFSSNLSHHRLPSVLRTDSTALWLDRFFWASRFLFPLSSLVFFIWFPAAD